MAAAMRIIVNFSSKNLRIYYGFAVKNLQFSNNYCTVSKVWRGLYSNFNRLKISSTSVTSYSTGSNAQKNHNTKDPERLFIQDDVQKILMRITGFDVDKIFRVRPIQDLKPPEYKLVTDDELAKMKADAEERAKSYLQMPPVMNAWKPSVADGIVSDDKLITNFEEGDAKYVFTDISNDIPYRRRAVVVREVSGTLRVADPRERDRILHVYFPREGKFHNMPKMFEEELLEKVLAEHRYEYILDSACNQFEPDDPDYIRVVQRTYEHVASRNKFDDLRSTRHFGPMAFYLAFHKKIEGLLVDMLHRDLLMDGANLVQLYHIIHPDCASALLAKQETVNNPMELLKMFAKNDAKEGGIIELALQAYEAHHSKQESAAASAS